jgi:pimeloyl-ACP methyl ester carboxylesterase
MSNPIPPSPAFIVSLRKDTGGGVPGDSFGPAKYMLQVRPNPPSGAPDPTDPNTYLLTDDVGSSAWAAKLALTAANGPVLIFIHGYDNLAPAVVTRYVAVNSGMGIARGKGKVVTVVCFDWPTTHGLSAYPSDQAAAVQSGPLLLSTCIQVLLNAGISSSNIHILTHSMGGYVVQNAFAKNISYQVGQVLIAEADVLEVAFDVAVNTPPTSALGCFMKCVTHLTVYWSGVDLALKDAVLAGQFVPPCSPGGTPTKPIKPRRLGYCGLQGPTRASYSSQLTNVGYADYYTKVYAPTAKNDPPDSHVWPILGTVATPALSGDLHFMTDVWEVVTGATRYTYRNPSTTNDWTFST